MTTQSVVFILMLVAIVMAVCTIAHEKITFKRIVKIDEERQTTDKYSRREEILVERKLRHDKNHAKIFRWTITLLVVAAISFVAVIIANEPFMGNDTFGSLFRLAGATCIVLCGLMMYWETGK